MKGASRIFLSGQVIVAVAVILGFTVTAQAKATSENKFKPSFKVDRCDCLGFSQDIPTFLSDLNGGYDFDIYGEGRNIAEAEQKADQMCKEVYLTVAEISKLEHPDSVTQSGCEKLKSNPDGDWVSL